MDEIRRLALSLSDWDIQVRISAAEELMQSEDENVVSLATDYLVVLHALQESRKSFFPPGMAEGLEAPRAYRPQRLFPDVGRRPPFSPEQIDLLRQLGKAGLEWSVERPNLIVGGTSISTGSGIVFFERAFAIQQLSLSSYKAHVGATRGFSDAERASTTLQGAINFVLSTYRERGLLKGKA